VLFSSVTVFTLGDSVMSEATIICPLITGSVFHRRLTLQPHVEVHNMSPIFACVYIYIYIYIYICVCVCVCVCVYTTLQYFVVIISVAKSPCHCLRNWRAIKRRGVVYARDIQLRSTRRFFLALEHSYNINYLQIRTTLESF